jgi:methylated-DNA-[protein]-cysteine S-methyltransferase
MLGTIRFTHIESPIGPLLLTMERDCLTQVCMSQQKRSVEVLPDWISDARPFRAIAQQFDEYFCGRVRQFVTPIRFQGTEFQRSVWNELLRIPYGSTITYGELARRIGRPKAVRAVGLANGRNPIPIIVPCHRVIGADGKLTGFGGGLPNKAFLLQLEREHALIEDDDEEVRLEG